MAKKVIDTKLMDEKAAKFAAFDPYVYPAVITAIHDGDTVTMDIDLGFDTIMKNQKIRLYGINCPELKVKVDGVSVDNQPGIDALNHLKSLVGSLPAKVLVQTYRDQREKYGRYLATIWSYYLYPNGGTNCNQEQLNAGHAKTMKY